MNGRRGFALVTVLWLFLLLSVVVSTGAAAVSAGIRASENRIYLTRATWAARSCLELIRARFETLSTTALPDSLALATTVWCRADWFNDDERVNPNVLDSVGLQRVLEDEARVASILDWIDSDEEVRSEGAEADWYREHARPTPRNMPIEHVAELQLVRGFEKATVAELEQVFTTRGSGKVSANRAPPWALRAVSVLSDGDVRAIASRRAVIQLDAPEQVASLIRRELTIDEFRELSDRLSFDETRRTVRVLGLASAGERTLVSTLIAQLRESEGRLHVDHMEIR